MKSALKMGASLTVPQIKSTITALGHLPPSRGSGKNQSVLKKDLLDCLVSIVFQGLSKEERDKLVASLLHVEVKADVGEPMDLIEAVSYLDASEQDQFRNLVTECVDKLQKSHEEDVEAFKEDVKKSKDTKDSAHEKPEQAEEPSSSSGLKRPLHEAMEIKPAQDREVVIGRQREAGKSRKPTPQTMKDLLPDVPQLYLAWLPENRLVQAQFQGRSFPGKIGNVLLNCFKKKKPMMM